MNKTVAKSYRNLWSALGQYDLHHRIILLNTGDIANYNAISSRKHNDALLTNVGKAQIIQTKNRISELIDSAYSSVAVASQESANLLEAKKFKKFENLDELDWGSLSAFPETREETQKCIDDIFVKRQWDAVLFGSKESFSEFFERLVLGFAEVTKEAIANNESTICIVSNDFWLSTFISIVTENKIQYKSYLLDGRAGVLTRNANGTFKFENL